LMLFLSRTREYMADTGCVELMRDNQPLANALLKIDADYKDNSQEYDQDLKQTPHEGVRNASYIFDPHHAGIAGMASVTELGSTHPSLKNRLAAIGFRSTNS